MVSSPSLVRLEAGRSLCQTVWSQWAAQVSHHPQRPAPQRARGRVGGVPGPGPDAADGGGCPEPAGASLPPRVAHAQGAPPAGAYATAHARGPLVRAGCPLRQGCCWRRRGRWSRWSPSPEARRLHQAFPTHSRLSHRVDALCPDERGAVTGVLTRQRIHGHAGQGLWSRLLAVASPRVALCALCRRCGTVSWAWWPCRGVGRLR